jgi:hypothetical protein
MGSGSSIRALNGTKNELGGHNDDTSSPGPTRRANASFRRAMSRLAVPFSSNERRHHQESGCMRFKAGDWLPISSRKRKKMKRYCLDSPAPTASVLRKWGRESGRPFLYPLFSPDPLRTRVYATCGGRWHGRRALLSEGFYHGVVTAANEE